MELITQVYTQLYQLFDTCTPLQVDCGRSCGSACCTDEGGEGMFLYPGEERMLQGSDCFTIEPSAFHVQGRPVLIALCKGRCERQFRPLACRIFPLFPYVKRCSKPLVIMDPRANSICPVARVMKPEELDPRFVNRVTRTALLLSQFSETRIFMEEQSELLDEMCGSDTILNKLLFK